MGVCALHHHVPRFHREDCHRDCAPHESRPPRNAPILPTLPANPHVVGVFLLLRVSEVFCCLVVIFKIRSCACVARRILWRALGGLVAWQRLEFCAAIFRDAETDLAS